MLSLSELQAQAFSARALVFVLRFRVFAEALRLANITRTNLHDFDALA